MKKKGRSVDPSSQRSRGLKSRFGIDVGSDAELKSLVKDFDLTRKRIREIEAKRRRKTRAGEAAMLRTTGSLRTCRRHMRNKPLVPTRTGEAPLLAAQRRR
jgi:hypothetical protein